MAATLWPWSCVIILVLLILNLFLRILPLGSRLSCHNFFSKFNFDQPFLPFSYLEHSFLSQKLHIFNIFQFWNRNYLGRLLDFGMAHWTLGLLSLKRLAVFVMLWVEKTHVTLAFLSDFETVNGALVVRSAHTRRWLACFLNCTWRLSNPITFFFHNKLLFGLSIF